MTATVKLLTLLKEHGVEHYEHEAPATDCIAFFDGEGWHDCWESVDGEVNVTFSMTPAQVIAATLGATDARPTQVESSETCEADETDTWECVRDDLGGYGKTMTVHVMECTECGHVYEHVNGDYEYCPRCGRKREDVSE